MANKDNYTTRRKIVWQIKKNNNYDDTRIRGKATIV